MVDQVSATRSDRAKALEQWADHVDPADLKLADTEDLSVIADLVERRSDVDADLTEAVRQARRAKRSWAEIGEMLGVSKQAAQRKYSKVATSGS